MAFLRARPPARGETNLTEPDQREAFETVLQKFQSL
jgi:hypothetical protein